MTPSGKPVDQAVLVALSRATTDGANLHLQGQLDRKLYAQVRTVIEAAGGKWNRRAEAHVFDGPAADAIEAVLLTGRIVRPQDFGFFETSGEALESLIDAAAIRQGDRVLEPSAGTGNVVGAALAAGAGFVQAVELLVANAVKIAKRFEEAAVAEPPRLTILNGNFLNIDPPGMWRPFDRVVMNPPFNGRADLAHVRHAARFLTPGGRLAAIMASGVLFRADRASVDFRSWVSAQGGEIAIMPEGSFKAAGTGVNTVLVTIAAVDPTL